MTPAEHTTADPFEPLILRLTETPRRGTPDYPEPVESRAT